MAESDSAGQAPATPGAQRLWAQEARGLLGLSAATSHDSPQTKVDQVDEAFTVEEPIALAPSSAATAAASLMTSTVDAINAATVEATQGDLAGQKVLAELRKTDHDQQLEREEAVAKAAEEAISAALPGLESLLSSLEAAGRVRAGGH